MNAHFLFISFIIVTIIIFYFTFFKDLPQKHWKWWNSTGFMPMGLESYRQMFKAIVIFILLFSIIIYILFLLDVI